MRKITSTFATRIHSQSTSALLLSSLQLNVHNNYANIIHYKNQNHKVKHGIVNWDVIAIIILSLLLLLFYTSHLGLHSHNVKQEGQSSK